MMLKRSRNRASQAFKLTKLLVVETSGDNTGWANVPPKEVVWNPDSD